MKVCKPDAVSLVRPENGEFQPSSFECLIKIYLYLKKFCFLIALRLMHVYIIRYHKKVIYGVIEGETI